MFTKMLHKTFSKHKEFWLDKNFIFSVFLSGVFFFISMIINYMAVIYSTERVGNANTDILLQNLPVVNTDIIFSEGALLFVFFIIVLFILEPKIIAFTLKSIAFFICVRSGFVIMTHLAPPVGAISTDLFKVGYLSQGADLFFSGHTGVPFLMSLLFWDNKFLRYLFLSCSVLAGIAVILGHLHYTIDVFSAYFITHGIYLMSVKFFGKDYKLFKEAF